MDQISPNEHPHWPSRHESASTPAAHAGPDPPALKCRRAGWWYPSPQLSERGCALPTPRPKRQRMRPLSRSKSGTGRSRSKGPLCSPTRDPSHAAGGHDAPATARDGEAERWAAYCRPPHLAARSHAHRACAPGGIRGGMGDDGGAPGGG
eukprot:scaffold3610_cov129-Isochrysis_galbana.AAC.2